MSAGLQCCTRCGAEKPLDAFGWARGRRKPQSICRDCRRQRARDKYWSDPEAARARVRATHLRLRQNPEYRERVYDRNRKPLDPARVEVKPGEEWRPVVGGDGYEVSNFGRVRRSMPGVGTRVGLILKRQYDTRGYPMVQLWANGKRRPAKIHRLVIEAFIGPAPSVEHCAAHNDGVPENCFPENLRWATQAENHADKLLHGTHNRGERHGAHVLTAEMVLRARRECVGYGSIRRLAREFGVSAKTLGAATRRRSWAWLDDEASPK